MRTIQELRAINEANIKDFNSEERNIFIDTVSEEIWEEYREICEMYFEHIIGNYSANKDELRLSLLPIDIEKDINISLKRYKIISEYEEKKIKSIITEHIKNELIKAGYTVKKEELILNEGVFISKCKKALELNIVFYISVVGMFIVKERSNISGITLLFVDLVIQAYGLIAILLSASSFVTYISVLISMIKIKVKNYLLFVLPIMILVNIAFVYMFYNYAHKIIFQE